MRRERGEVVVCFDTGTGNLGTLFSIATKFLALSWLYLGAILALSWRQLGQELVGDGDGDGDDDMQI